MYRYKFVQHSTREITPKLNSMTHLIHDPWPTDQVDQLPAAMMHGIGISYDIMRNDNLWITGSKKQTCALRDGDERGRAVHGDPAARVGPS